jgi:hypothetical protein
MVKRSAKLNTPKEWMGNVTCWFTGFQYTKGKGWSDFLYRHSNNNFLFYFHRHQCPAPSDWCYVTFDEDNEKNIPRHLTDFHQEPPESPRGERHLMMWPPTPKKLGNLLSLFVFVLNNNVFFYLH